MIFVDDHRYKWLTMVTVGTGILASTLDGSILNLAYPALTEAFNTEPSTVLWVTVAFLLISASLALPLGTVGDMVGRKRLYISGCLVFTLGLALVSVSQNIGQMIAFRIVQGVGQGMMVATGNALIIGAFPDTERGKALGIIGALVGVGLASGPLVGGVILEFLGWRALFWTRLPVGMLVLIIAPLVLRSDSRVEKAQEFDYLGTIALMVGLSALLLFINRAPLDGASKLVLLLGVTSGIGLCTFVFIERKAVVPLFELSLLRQRLFSMAVTSSLFQFVAQAAFMFLMPFYLLQGLGMKPSEAGPVLMTLQVTRLVISPISGILSDRFESRTIATIGLGIMCIGYLLLLRLDETSSLVHIVTGLILAGSGSAMFLPPNNSIVMGSVPRDRLGMASAIIAVVRQVGISFGITVMGTVYSLQELAHRTALASAGLSDGEVVEKAVILGYRDGFTIAILFVIAAVFCSVLRGRDLPKVSRHSQDVINPGNDKLENR